MHRLHAQNARYYQLNTFVALALKTMCVTFAHSDVGYQKAFLDVKNALQVRRVRCQSMPAAMASLLVGLIAQVIMVQ